MNLKEYITNRASVVNQALQTYLEQDYGPFSLIGQAMAYSVNAGGKRVRPIMLLAANDIFDGDEKAAMPFACALEMIHTYTLIHDDLPAMDNDDMRRGRPTNHKIYGEGQALLAGNSLLTLAYEICLDAANSGLAPMDRAVLALLEISKAIGVMGVMGGQSLDIMWEGESLEYDQVETICHHKTATLITVSVLGGAILAGAANKDIEAMKSYGNAIGLAFQVADDILNVTGDVKKLGKATGTDGEKGKTTYPALLGLEGAKKRANELLEHALEAIEPYGEKAWVLRELAKYIVTRDH